MKILLLEDDVILAELIEEYLVFQGMHVVCAFDGLEAEALTMAEKFDLLLLDVNVPKLSGFDFLEELRCLQDNTPAIFITSLDRAEDVEKGFGVGADDYLKKPFDLLELKARIENIRRRYHIEDRRSVQIGDGTYYDYAERLLRVKEHSYTLSEKEARILEYFIARASQLLSFEEILNNVWSYEDAPTLATLRTYIKNLRKKLGEEAITNVKGVGYRFH